MTQISYFELLGNMPPMALQEFFRNLRHVHNVSDQDLMFGLRDIAETTIFENILELKSDEMLNLMSSFDLDVNVFLSDGYTPLGYVTELNWVHGIDFLLGSLGATMDLIDRIRQAEPVWYCLANGSLDAYKMYVHHGYKLSFVRYDGDIINPLVQVASFQYYELFKYLLAEMTNTHNSELREDYNQKAATGIDTVADGLFRAIYPS